MFVVDDVLVVIGPVVEGKTDDAVEAAELNEMIELVETMALVGDTEIVEEDPLRE